MKSFTESMRYEYNLNPDSLVWDCGGYEGNFASEINRKYGCKVAVFEPIPDFYKRIRDRFSGNSKITVHNVAMGNSDTPLHLYIRGDSSGQNAKDGVEVLCSQISITEYLPIFEKVDLLKLNIEGMEFQVLESVIAKGIASHFKNIQVQFHPVVPEFQKRYEAIRDALLKTHEFTYCEPWCWENYQLKP